MEKCQIVKTGKIENSAGDEEEILVCYCKTTDCQKIKPKFYDLPADFKKLKKITLNPYVITKTKR